MKIRRFCYIIAVLSLGACAGISNFNFSDLFDVENKPVYKIGKPYEIAGETYYPREDYQYSEIGLASWYGGDFHGGLTANGEVFDMNALTAAHKTLPMPSFVRVTNLVNGKNLVLRVNDRGPFVPGRIIDVSRKAAKILGFRDHGVTKVKVEILPEDSLRLKEKMLGMPQDTSDMIDNTGGEGNDFKQEELRESYQADNTVEYFPLYEDEKETKRFSPEYEEVLFEEELSDDMHKESEQKTSPSLQQLPDGQAIKVGHRQYIKAYPIPEEVYPATVDIAPVYTTPVQYQTVPVAPVEYIPNPYYTYQTPVVESVSTLVPQSTYEQSVYDDNIDIIQDSYVKAIKDKPLPVMASGSYYVQAASYKKKLHADELKTKLSSSINDVIVTTAEVKGAKYYRVRIGPVIDEGSANAIADNLNAYGIKKPAIIKIK